MSREIITTGKTMEEALAKAYVELDVRADQCEIEVIDKPKKSLFGKIKVEAKVKVTVKESILDEKKPLPKEPVKKTSEKDESNCQPVSVSKESHNEEKLAAALGYLKEILDVMGLHQVEIKTEEKDGGAVLTLEGDDLGILIGRHGETLDALQYLTSLVCNRVEGSYFRITLDCGNYREKREEALKELAKKISAKVKRTGRSQMLEPMNPYERRIIHAVLSDIDGVTSKSKGDEPNRRIMILPTNRSKGGYGKGGNRSSYHKSSKPRQPERTMEEILKSDLAEEEKNTKLYSKIEL